VCPLHPALRNVLNSFLIAVWCPFPGADPGFKVRGADLKKLRRAEGGANIFGVFRVKNYIFSNFMGGGGEKTKIILTGSLLKSLHIKHFASHHFPKYFHIIKKTVFKYWTFFFYRYVMAVCKNVFWY
jgi:hypothetical protein